MFELQRTVRFCLNHGAASGSEPVSNSYSAWPAMRGLGRYYELTVTCRAEADPRTGYCVDIRAIDRAVRSRVIDLLAGFVADESATSGGGDVPMGRVMRQITAALTDELGPIVTAARLHLTPMVSIELSSQAMEHVILRQRYEFSAAHRLHVPELGEQRNREIFGKCNNPAGHGHNYTLEVAVRCPIDPSGHVLSIRQLDGLVDDRAVRKLDHKHLNEDVPQFAGLNPSVEHIAKVIWELLAEPIASLGDGGTSLDEVRVWETAKTMCVYRGADAAKTARPA